VYVYLLEIKTDLFLEIKTDMRVILFEIYSRVTMDIIIFIARYLNKHFVI